MSFRAEHLAVAGAEVGTSSEQPAWWRVEVAAGPFAPGQVLVLTDARLGAGLSSGEADDEIRFRWLVAEALNTMLSDVGEDSLASALRAPQGELRLGRLTL